MDSKTQISDEIPTALPGFEDEDAREKLLLEATEEDPDTEADEEELDLSHELVKPKKRRWQVLRTVAGFAVFVFTLALAISWFFGVGWFSEQKPHPISRNSSKDAPVSPATEDEKLKMALSLVAAKPPSPASTPGVTLGSEEDLSSADKLALTADIPSGTAERGADRANAVPVNDAPQYSVRVDDKRGGPDEVSMDAKKPAAVQGKGLNISNAQKDVSGDARGRSLFFGLPKKIVETDKPGKNTETVAVDKSPRAISAHRIPFGTLLPVRLIGSIYTFRNSGGVVRMELTRAVEGNGYSYPAGTIVVGNVRAGESIRAFVTIIGLIDPISGELVRFSGELLGRDGGSGIEGRRRKLTSQWSRFFSGLKDTAASVLGSVGAIRSGSTVILSEPIRKGSESMSEDLSGAILNNRKEDTFIEVSAGANGYVLVTALPENSSAVASEPRTRADNK